MQGEADLTYDEIIALRSSLVVRLVAAEVRLETLAMIILFPTALLVSLLAGLASDTVLGGSRPGSGASPRAAERPNILFILTDDMDVALLDAMPSVKRLLVDQGTSFPNAFVNVSLCCPSRVSILRGQYAHNHQVRTNQAPDGGYRVFIRQGMETSTVGTWLADAGYRTGYFGKYLNGYPGNQGQTHVPPGWTAWASPVDGDPYGNFNYTMNEDGRLVAYGDAPEDYMTDVLARKADDFIRAGAGQPFFIHLATFAPHSPATPAQRHADLFPDAEAPRTPSFNEADVSDKPDWVTSRSLLTSRQVNLIDAFHRRRLQSLQAVDEAVAALVATLESTGQLDNTFIFFMGDNGFHLGQHRLAQGKQAPYEEDVRVPFVVRGPGVPHATLAQPVLNIDLAPTFAALSDAPIPAFVDGRSLVPLLGAEPPSTDAWRRVALLEHWPAAAESADEAQGIPEFAGLHVVDRVYVRYDTGEREYYDLRSDPYQLDNAIGTLPATDEARLAAWLAAMRACAGDACRVIEAAGPDTATPSAGSPTPAPSASPAASATPDERGRAHLPLMLLHGLAPTAPPPRP